MKEYSPLNSMTCYEVTLELLKQRGVQVDDIAEIVLFLQKDYFPHLTLEACRESVAAVLRKREVQNALMTGIQLDMLAEKSSFFPRFKKLSKLMNPSTASTR